MKKLLLIVSFLLPITIISFVVRYKTLFFNEKEKTVEKTPPFNYIVQVTDKNLSLDLEDYVIGVIAGEMPALFEEEALKAQGVAIRSYALSKLNNQEILVSSTTSDQVFLTKEEMLAKWGAEYDLYYEKIARCAKATENLVLKRDDQILKTYYFAMSNGQTENSMSVFGEETLQSTDSKWDNESLINFKAQKSFTVQELLSGLGLTGDRITIGETKRNTTGRVESIIINTQSFSGLDIRKKLALRSTDFTFEQVGESYLITTKGYGHGVGMSQYGANGMAKEGYHYQDILKHYYLNAEIQNI